MLLYYSGSYKNMITAYKDLSRDAIARMVKSLEDMKSYSVLEEYRQVVSKMVNAIKVNTSVIST